MTLMMCSCFEVTCKLGHHIYLTPGPVILTPGLDRFSQDGTYDLTEDKVPCKLLTGSTHILLRPFRSGDRSAGYQHT